MATDTGLRPAEPSAEEPRTADGGRRALRAAWVVPLALLLVAGGLRFYRLDHPDRLYFDEVYYAEDGAALLERGVEEGFVVHPPLGKWLIAGGIALFGDAPFGWRAGMALAGTLTVLMTYLAGLRLFRRRGVAALAAFLVTVDGLAFTMSRISMLDALLALLVVTAFWLLLRDRDATWAGVGAAPDEVGAAVPADADADADARVDADAGVGADAGATSADRPLPRRPHRDRWLAGLVLGLALATKWSAILAIGAAGLLVLVSELALRKRCTGRWLEHWPRLVVSGLATLVLLPAVVYVASYAGWFANFADTRPGERRCPDGAATCAVPLPQMLGDWWEEQAAIAGFHGDLDATHRYRAPATTWPVLARPVAYYYESCTASARAEKEAAGEVCEIADDHVAEILGLGNPAVWWLALLAYPVLAFAVADRRSWAAAAIGVFLLGQYLPWLAASRPLFLFYMTPLVPFLALAVAFAAAEVARHPFARWLPAAVGVLAFAAFAFWYPIWSGMEIPEASWRLRIWFDSWI